MKATAIPAEGIAGVVLELTVAEADALLAITGFVGGEPGVKSPRGHIDSLREALSEALGKFYGNTTAYSLLASRGGVNFNNYKEGASA